MVVTSDLLPAVMNPTCGVLLFLAAPGGDLPETATIVSANVVPMQPVVLLMTLAGRAPCLWWEDKPLVIES